MSNGMKNKLLGLFIAIFLVTDVMAQQIDPSLLQKAKAAGVTQDQIDAALSGQKSSVNAAKSTSEIGISKDESVERIIQGMLPKQDTLSRNKLQIFGHEIFSTRNLTFAPDYNMATPSDYVLGAGDEIVIDVWGASEMNVKSKLSPEGSITLSGIGPVYLNGLTISEAEERVKSRLGKVFGGMGSRTFARVTLGQIRSIKVNLMGEVMIPGTYTLPSMATLFNALYSAGGVDSIGSLREIKVFRKSKEVASFDAYDFLINGKYENNLRLEDNDMVIVKPYDALVAIRGRVKRARIYEMTHKETLADLIRYSGGFTGDAYTRNLKVKRSSGRMQEIFTVDNSDMSTFNLRDGDTVSVDTIIQEYSNRLTIKGAVWRPGEYQLSQETDSLSKLIKKAEGLKGNEFTTRGQIIRKKKDFTYQTVAFNTREVAMGNTDIVLMPDDEIFIPTIFDLREDYYLIVKGEVNKPDTLRYTDNMTVEDAIIQCGGIKESASVDKIEVARRIENQSEYTSKTAEIFTFNISKDLALSSQVAGFSLKPFDEVIVRNSPGYKVQKSVVIKGEVLFEGEYVLASNSDRLSDLIRKTGGLTMDAYIEGASLKRKISDEEARKMETMKKMARTGVDKDTISLKEIESEAEKEKTYPVGINLKEAIKNPGGENDVVLVGGDEINIPKYNAVVKIKGAVLYPNAVTCVDGKRLQSYLSQSGGYQSNAKKKPYVVYMSGKVASTRSFFGIKNYPKIEPGCEIVVPMKPESKSGIGMSGFLGIASASASLATVIALLLNTLK